jgi:uncharacterized protein YceH (UPF0502 family)
VIPASVKESHLVCTIRASSSLNTLIADILGEVTALIVVLNEVECRVLGSLIEKDITTPDYYPLSLNALINACNQKNNREPVTTLDEASVRQALNQLEEKGLVARTGNLDSRVPKYEHRIQEAFNFTRGETAVLCVMLLRGPQTPGELRGRTERMHHFQDLTDVQSALQRLMQRDLALVKILPRQPGTKESRYMHLLSGDVEAGGDSVVRASSAPSASSAPDTDRITTLENEVSALREEVASLRHQLESLLK